MKNLRLFVLAVLLIAPAAISQHQLMDGPGPVPLCPTGPDCVSVQ